MQFSQSYVNSETLKEAFGSIRLNKTRTILAGFSIAWGIFILAILLGVGHGFKNGVMDQFSIFAQRSLYVYGGTTSIKYRNLNEGRKVEFHISDLFKLKNRYAEIEAISPEILYQAAMIQKNDKIGVFPVTGVSLDYFRIKLLSPEKGGRLFNRMDSIYQRNVAVIGRGVADFFLKDQLDDNLLDIEGINYLIIGILREENIMSIQERNSIYIPYLSMTKEMIPSSLFTSFSMILDENTDSETFISEFRGYLGYKYKFDKYDKQALYIANIETQTTAFKHLFQGLELLIWVIGLCFLLSGMIGISNIMLIVVKERTNEIGIRQAVGALPAHIIRLIIFESAVITLIAGISGIVLGACSLKIFNWIIDNTTTGEGIRLIQEASLDLPAVLAALFFLLIAGIIAGLFPAVKAAQISPANAIRFETRG